MTRVIDGTGNDRATSGRLARAVDAVRWEAGSVGRAARAVVRGPGRERDLLVQSLKAALAALLAWLVAQVWLGDPMALMAPWVALVLVQATVYSSLVTGARQFAAICVGALVASGAQAVTDDNTGALALSVPVLVLLSNWRRFGDQGIYAATTAVFTIASGTVSVEAVGHRLGQAALGAVIGVAVNAFVLPPVHLRDVRENLAALAREAGEVLSAVAGDLREGEWDAQTAVGRLNTAKRLQDRLDALRSARGWSRESLLLTSGWLRTLHRAPTEALPSEDEDERLGRVTGHVTALTRSLAVAADEERSAAAPDPEVLRSYGKLLELLADSCRAEADRLLGEEEPGDPLLDERTDAAMRELHTALQEGLTQEAGQGAARTAVLGTLVLQAENLWADLSPDARGR
ncbi:aromatic acid exporter family protein [Streptomyces cellulosae]|uniref:aromatic acid exporter family protein n=1 Tax=Streptomyces TaxID=1883 RepID=UPI0013A01C40|nr:aromatic acid exporter family protein [Streptomyces cellulosae]MXQ61338.1 FUSC family protein [Streptomyces sp. XHT-2]WSB46233.1 aromatic acid exporter family protein [Streptomyces cellulosae]WTB80232.1 aromatic acid exporter family protein [Streptomyces cellulosae]WTC54281.1 aromatic acid exporter family protein [Streptomyces cellulosae]